MVYRGIEGNRQKDILKISLCVQVAVELGLELLFPSLGCF